MRSRPIFAAALAASLLTASAALAQTPQAAAGRLDEFLDRFGGIEPGYAVVVVTADDVLLSRVEGVRNIRTGAPLTPQTPIYIASQTKAYIGLLAATLDERGILDLDSTIADHWPEIDLPGEVDAADWTLRDLLTHQVPIEADLLTWLEAYATRVDPADYPRLIAEHGTVREPGFSYDNLGYNIYGAILETATGRRWQDWLDEILFDPLDLANTSARTSDFDGDRLSWNHIWQGEDDGWHAVPPKTDAMMQSAGGLVTSPEDMATWLQLQLRAAGPDGSGIPARAVEAAQTSHVDTHQEDGRNAYELPCSGYSLGWNVCDFEGHALLIHGGGYTGARTVMAFSPDLGVGVGVFSNSDNMTGWLSGRTVVMYLQFLTEDPEADRWADIRVDYYPQQARRLLDHRRAREAEARAEERWGGWAWQPDAAERADYAGRYDLGDGYRVVEVREGEGGLVASLGDARYRLDPARPDLFGGVSAPFETPETFRFRRDAAGRIVALDQDGDLYERVDGR
jgi:CubicO group peptidase (beta-lactamase class C family)